MPFSCNVEKCVRGGGRKTPPPSTNRVKNTKNCLLGREELKAKINLLEKEKRNAIKRVGYWQNKFASEGVQLDKSDDEDLQTIFDTIDKSKVPEGFELLIAQQKQALVAKGSSGWRWHPK